MARGRHHCGVELRAAVRIPQPPSPPSPLTALRRRSLFRAFSDARRSATATALAERERLLNRVSKLSHELLRSRGGAEGARRAVPWRDEGNAACAQCARRGVGPAPRAGVLGKVRGLLGGPPHCWVCGVRVCDAEGCAEPLVLQDIAAFLGLAGPQKEGEAEVPVPTCSCCQRAVEAVHAQAVASKGPNELAQLYAQLRAAQLSTEALFGDLSEVAGRIRHPAPSGVSPDDVQLCRELKQRIAEAFRAVQALAQRIEALPGCADGLRAGVAKQIRRGAALWQQPRTLTLQSLTAPAQ